MPRGPQRARPPENKAMQWQDMPTVAKRDVNAQMRNLGMAASGIEAQQTRLITTRDRPGSKAITRTKAGQRLASLAAVGEHLVDRPITHAGAAAHRVALVQRGGQRTLREGTDPGHNWYFAHNRKLDNIAYATGHDKDRVVAASAVMSPQNNPEQELTAVHALAHAHSHPKATIQVTQTAADAARAAGAEDSSMPSLDDYVGRSMSVHEIPSAHLAAMSTAGVREHIITNAVDLPAIAKGGVKGNVTKAIDVLRGHVAPHEAINPQSSPKVWSYHENIAKSVHGSAEQVEFNRRMDVATGLTGRGQIPGQSSMDLYPDLRGATHGPLDPHGATAEDTWQQAISTRQKLRQVEVPGRQGRAAKQSPAKFSVGEGGSANQKLLRSPAGMTGVGTSAAMHAWQNQATQLAAGRLSRNTGEIIPTTGVQAGGWTEARRHAGKNIEEAEIVRRTKAQGIQESLF